MDNSNNDDCDSSYTNSSNQRFILHTPIRAYSSVSKSESPSQATDSLSTSFSGSVTISNLSSSESKSSTSPTSSITSCHLVANNDSDSPLANHSSLQSEASSKSVHPDSTSLNEQSVQSKIIHSSLTVSNENNLCGEADNITSGEDKSDDNDDKRRVTTVENDGNNQKIKETDKYLKKGKVCVDMPKLSIDFGNDLYLVKFPNFLSVNARPYDQNTYEDEIDEEETMDEEGRARVKLKVENTIRWRETVGSDGNVVKESNTRLVKWSDGTMSLHLGSEVFNVDKQFLVNNDHLCIRQGTGLQGQGIFRKKLSFRPHSTESFTHRRMALSLANRSQETSGIKLISSVETDPEANRDEKIKKELRKLREQIRKDTRNRSARRNGNYRSSYLEFKRKN